MKEQCKNYLEIGSHYGHSLMTNLQSNYETKYMGIDLFNRWGDGTIINMKRLVELNIKKFNKNNYQCKLIQGDSKNIKTLNIVKKYFNEGIDLLFIDGDHSYKGVLDDFELYFPLVNSGGYIVFDDYLPLLKPNGEKRESPIAIDKIAEKYKDKVEIIGLVDDLVDVHKLKNGKSLDGKNMDFIMKKK